MFSTNRHLHLRGRWRIRTADPLLVRQTLWTSWAKRPLAYWKSPRNNAVSHDFVMVFPMFLPESECKGRDFSANSQIFQEFFSKKISNIFINGWLSVPPFTPAFWQDMDMSLYLTIFLTFFSKVFDGASPSYGVKNHWTAQLSDSPALSSVYAPWLSSSM